MIVRWLIRIHRYLGIALSPLFVVWFASGISMMYARDMPRLTRERQLERLPPLDPSRVRISPSDATRRLGQGRRSDPLTLVTVMGRPAYRYAGEKSGVVFADSGELMGRVGPDAARTIAAQFVNLSQDRLVDAGMLTRPDQWTLMLGRYMPLYRFRVDDASRTELYVSASTAEVTMLTTRGSRVLAWIGAIPHWLYFAPLRVHGRLWTRIVIWTSILGCVLASIGLILGVTQFAVRYSGWLRWHYVAGAIFGLFTLTWVFSGLMSMEPWSWTRRQGLHVNEETLSGGQPDLAEFGVIEPAVWTLLARDSAIKEIEYRLMQDEPYYVLHRVTDERPDRRRILLDRVVVNARTLQVKRDPFADQSIVERLQSAVTNARIVESTVLTDYDSYYYSQGRERLLPVLRVKFDDPDRTWIYVDPATSEIVANTHRFGRLERWLFNGLHSLDFAFWHQRRPLWDMAMITLLLGGLASSGTGLWIGMRRLQTNVRGAARRRRHERHPRFRNVHGRRIP